MEMPDTNSTETYPKHMEGLHWLDVTVIGIYFAVILGVTLLSRWKTQRNASGYFLANRTMSWITVGASLFSSNIGAGHIIVLAGSGAATGIAVAGFEQSAVYVLMILGWLFIPVFLSAEVYTIPQYFKKRFASERIQLYLAVLSVLLYIFTKISVELYSGAVFIQRVMGDSSETMYVIIILLLVLVAIITIVGGFKAVMWTDSFQTFLMISGATFLMCLSLDQVGGWSTLVKKYPMSLASEKAMDISSNHHCGHPPGNFMTLLQEENVPRNDYPWVGMIFGLTINSIWYWCADQVMIQRVLSSKNHLHAKGGCILASYLKFLPLWLFVVPGMAARVLYREHVACASPESCTDVCGNPSGCSNTAYAELVLNLEMPIGLRGLMVVVIMAALTSTLTSVVSSISTIFTMDVWLWARRKFSSRGEPPDEELLVVGPVFAFLVVVVAALWVPILHNIKDDHIFDYIQKMSCFLVPPVGAVCILAVFWGRTTEPGSFWGLIVGLCLGMTRSIAEIVYPTPSCGADLDSRPYIMKLLIDRMHYLHYSGILWLVTTITTVSISLVTRPKPPESIIRLTFWTRNVTGFRMTPHLEQMDIEQAEQNVSGWKRALTNICGTTDCGTDKISEEDVSRDVQNTESTEPFEEPVFWRHFTNANAILCILLSTLMYSFFS